MLTANGSEHDVDAVVCAAHSDQALRLLSDADAVEHAVLGNVPYARNRAYLHTDIGLMPRQRSAGNPAPSVCAAIAVPARGRSEEHTSELQSLMRHPYADFCLKKKTQ